MPSIAVENYVKEIYLARHRKGEQCVGMGQVADAMSVSPGTATTMVKALQDQGYLVYRPRVGVELTEQGERLALGMLRRHRLIELFLVDVLALDWADIHEEAERLEHAISDKVLERLDQFLGYPTEDPHGDPIPTAAGELVESRAASLAVCPLHIEMRLVRTLNQTPAFLQFLQQHELKPGVLLRVIGRESAAEATQLALSDGRHITLGNGAAKKILVSPVSEDSR